MATARKKNGSEHIEHMELYAGLSERIGVLGAQLKGEHEQNVQALGHNFALLMEKLKPLDEIKQLRADVDKHSAQISFWKGCISIFGFIYTGALTFLGIHRH